MRDGHRDGKDAYPCRVIVYPKLGYFDPWDLVVSAGLNNGELGRLVAAYGQRLTTEECCKDQKNDYNNYYEGFPRDAVSLSTPERWDRMLLVFAWASYGWNVAGWAMETAGKARERRANTVKAYGTHAWWRWGHGDFAHHDLVWRTLLRAVRDFRRHIPPLSIHEVTEATSP